MLTIAAIPLEGKKIRNHPVWLGKPLVSSTLPLEPNECNQDLMKKSWWDLTNKHTIWSRDYCSNPFPRHPRTLGTFGEISWVVRNTQHPNTNVPRWSLSEVSISLCLTSNNMDEPGKSSFVIQRTAHTTSKCLLFFNNSLQTGNTW